MRSQPIGASTLDVARVGGYLSYLTGQPHFDRMVPHGSSWDGGGDDARSGQDGFAGTWWVTAEASCAA